VSVHGSDGAAVFIHGAAARPGGCCADRALPTAAPLAVRGTSVQIPLEILSMALSVPSCWSWFSLVVPLAALPCAPPAAAQDSGGGLESRVKSLEEQLRELKKQPPAAAGAPAPKAGESDLRVFWKDGLRLESTDGLVKLRLGGRFQVTSLFGGNDDFESAGKEIEDGAAFRRARLYFQGTVTDRFEFKFQYDFADTNKVKIADVWGEVKKIPLVGNARVGQFYEPVSFEQNTSDFDADFMERSVMNALSPARNIGAALHETYSGRLAWWLGAFVDDGSGDTATAQRDGDHSVSARVTGLPIDQDDDKTLLHVGASASIRNPTSGVVTYSAKPESSLAPVFITTGNLTNVEGAMLLGGEVAGQLGPIHVAAEYLSSQLDDAARNDPKFAGWLASAGWFITGESFTYNHVDGVFAAPKVGNSFDKADGFGALELCARYSELDLTGGTVRGGKMRDVIVGVNWFLSNNMKVAVDGVNSRVDGIGTVNLLELWFQCTF
jgi:phosphate-selective porin OprO/OprP